MKKTLLSILYVVGISSISFGQVEMSVGTPTDISGTQLDYTSAGADVSVDVFVTNKTGNTKNLTISRERINETPGWTDDLCWGPVGNALGGACYTASDMPTNPWTTPAALNLENDSTGQIFIYIHPTGDFGCTVYRYRVMEGPSEHSYLDISVCKSANTDELEIFAVSLAPNPANSSFSITMNTTEETEVEIIDVLGNVVLKETVTGNSQTIDTQSFRNGVYFVRVSKANHRPIIRKVIVRH